MNLKFIISYALLSVFNALGLENFDPNVKGFDDSILFKINWPGKDGITNEIFDVPGLEQMTVTTENDEKYRCLIPQLQEKEKNFSEQYVGPNPLDLISILFKQSSCSHRIEAYWTYELCHGKYIRQYHEEKEGKTVKLQEYYLGMWDATQQQKLRSQLEEEATKVTDHVPIKKIDGLNMPYLQLNMSDGTLCDVNSKPRQTNVLYICYIHGKHEIYSLKETSICEYEVIVLSPLLCDHPKYRPQESGEHVINCHPIDNTPKKPKSLLQWEAESLKLRHQKTNDERMQSVLAVFSLDKDDDEDVSHLRMEIHPIDAEDDVDGQASLVMPFSGQESSSNLDTSLNSFLSGSDCIQGDSGWWKYEFCYGKYIIQYHLEKDGSKTIINLGNFVKSAHLEWLQSNPHKRPEPLSVRKHVSHYYSGGTVCVKTGKLRHTEVRLKCLDVKYNQGSVSLYLLEPKVCQYILVVESREICQLLTKIDENGLYEPNEEIGFSKASYKNGYQPERRGDTGGDGDVTQPSAPPTARQQVPRPQDKSTSQHPEKEQTTHQQQQQQQPPQQQQQIPSHQSRKSSPNVQEVANEEVGLDNHIPEGDD